MLSPAEPGSKVRWPFDPPEGRRDSSGREHIAFPLPDGSHLHLILDRTDDSEGYAVTIPLDPDALGRIETCRRLLAALQGRAIPADSRMTTQQHQRQKNMLRAIDGHQAGASQRAIAEALLKTGNLPRDAWQSAETRFTMRRLISDARKLIAGGYRRLLRHRRHR